MALYNFHRVLIAIAIVFDFLFTFWALRQWRLTSDSILLVTAVASSVVTIGLIAYLVYFNRNLSLLRHIVNGQCWKCGRDIRSALMAQQQQCPNCGVALAQPAPRA
jgi:uncharacterized membrane protein